MDWASNILDRFLRYTAVDTMSDPEAVAGKHPSTDGQWDLLRMLERELRELGVRDVVLDGSGVVSANIEATAPGLPTVAFMAHVDTASDCNGNHVRARVIERYDGGDVQLREGISIAAADNPELARYKGETIIVSDGTSLLGADDKAGVAEIMAVVEALMADPSIRHGKIQVFFTSDEETGAGMDHFPMERFESEACYTLDGGERYVVETECFNAATVRARCVGRAAHLGSAKNTMVNALTMAGFILSSLPQAESPEATDGRDGYYCPFSLKGGIEEATLVLMLRDFDYGRLQERIRTVQELARAAELIFKGGKATVESQIVYRNMSEASEARPKAMELLLKAGRNLGMPLRSEVIRGGTDGARLAEKGIPCPNVFTGGHNYHSLREWAALPAMVDAAALVVETIRCWAGC